MTRPKAKGKARGARARVPPHATAEDCLYRGVTALLVDAARQRTLTVIEVAGVLTAVTHAVLANVWARAREQQRKAQAGSRGRNDAPPRS